jgi:hypothetical protein
MKRQMRDIPRLSCITEGLTCCSCGEGMPKNECSASQKECGHHCDHSWTHDQCCWCHEHFGEITTTN